MIWRLCYVRSSVPKGVTFFAADLVAATVFTDLWERMTKCPVLTLKPLGISRFTKKGKLR